MSSRRCLSADARRLVASQGLRAFAYGFGALLLGSTLKRRGFTSAEVGLVLAAVVAGTIIVSIALARWSDRLGRRRCYVALYFLLGAAGAAFALSAHPLVLIAVALTGTLSTDIVDNGPFTSLEQAMLAGELAGRGRIRGFSLYNTVAAGAGSLGALAAGGPTLLHRYLPTVPTDQHLFLVFVPVGLAGATVAWTLTPAVETSPLPHGQRRQPSLGKSRSNIVRLAGLFAADAFGGGFVVQAFIAYWFSVKFHTSPGQLGLIFFAVGILQMGSFFAAVQLTERYGLLATMVFTHLPSDLVLAAIAFAPNLTTAITLLLVRSMLSQMDVPTRQAYVMALVDPTERTAAAGYTNAARYLARPAGPALAGAGQSLLIGLPFLAAGAIKVAYDLVLWALFRHVPLAEQPAPPSGAEQPVGDKR
jgi:MFS family permease